MKGDLIPDRDYISRYCSAMQCTEEGQVTGAAFQIRPSDKYLSVNWLEFLCLGNRQEEIREVRRILSSKLTLGAKAKIAVLNVGNILNYVRSQSPDSRNLSVFHEPEENDPSHSGIYGLQSEDHLIADLIAEIVQETYPAR
ncbi:MAG: hypothetical protein A3G93_15460 [Nitrospinae bacterium RIFCSPLOWO2_12_FULL_45_22]|nr:MAG: hypothetical protein A3G93_15460 [Nitrospinae bacterium RIFCSPLOWO2_12_FULL_45_22]